MQLMRLKKYICIFLVIIFTAVSCKKDHNIAPKTNVDVYVAGDTYASNGYLAATYWKNGAPVVLTDSSVFSEASAIAIQGTDVYVAGYIMNSNHYTIAAYWKNGVLIKLGNDNSNSKAYGIALQGSNVYVSGEANIVYPNQSNPYTLTNPTYWKNGTPVNISASIPYISTFSGSIAADDNNLYIAGTNSTIGIYLKNNDVVPITDTNQFSGANSIAIKGNDVYVAGAVSSGAAYWKNGVMTKFDSPSFSQANDIAINGNEIYIAGIIAENNVFMATYWKNGTAIRLSNLSSTADAIAVNGSDAYVAGSNSLGAVYWKNGAVVQLGKGGAYDIVVIPRK